MRYLLAEKLAPLTTALSLHTPLSQVLNDLPLNCTQFLRTRLLMVNKNRSNLLSTYMEQILCKKTFIQLYHLILTTILLAPFFFQVEKNVNGLIQSHIISKWQAGI